ncbi:MAG: hypothetical protein GY845_33395 [Planctomycetes bacterium]|nr:hypothetical protein [Planctomycetota bacterium]
MCKQLIHLVSFVLVLCLATGVVADPLNQDTGPDGIVSVEAEHFDANVEVGGHTWEETGPVDGFTGELGMHAPNPTHGGHGNSGYAETSERLEYEINFVKTGTHYVWILAWGADGTDDSCHVGLDGVETPLSDRMTGWNGAYEWNNGRMDMPEPSQIEITSSGPHTLNVWVREDGLIIDKIVLTTNPDFTLSGAEEGPPESNRGAILNAYSPSPTEGEIYLDVWANLSWTAGATAASHDVYFSENFDNVNDGTGDTFQGNQAEAFLVVGFPGFAYPEGLVPGTTYYWRVDEIEADGTKHSGSIWSFTIPPKKAYNPVPFDGVPFIDLNPSFSWTAGFGTKLHTVYFGDNFEDVNSGVVGIPLGTNSYNPGTLEANKVYYWRVDEFDSITTYKGNVWSFKTAKTGGGLRGEYYQGTNFQNLMLTRIDPQVNFNWGDPGSPDQSVGNDNFSVRWSGEIEAPLTETYTFYTSSDDGARLWVDGQELVNDWTDQGVSENYGTIDLVAGNVYNLLMEYNDSSGAAVAELRWSSPSVPKQLIPQAALSPPVRAGNQNPSNGAADVTITPVLTWRAGDFASSHEVYFGTDVDAVNNATTSSPEYKGSQELGSESFVPGELLSNSTYYWRIDEVNDTNPESPWTGNVLSFTTGDFIIVDDFESYNDINEGEPDSNRIYIAWADGFNNPAVNGSVVGNATAPFAEQGIVHTGSQSMPYFYDNNNKYSEAELTLSPAQDWTRLDVTVLSLSFLGNAGNSVEPMYVKINGQKVLYNGDASDITLPRWNLWNIDLASVGTNLQNVTSLIIGFGNDTNPTAGGSGTVYFDDIRLHQAIPAVAAPLEEIWIEAEDADTITAPMEIYSDMADASGGEYIGTTDDVGNSSGTPPFPDGTASYNFTVEGGTYMLSCRIIIPNGDSFWFRIQGATTQTTNDPSGWVRWSDPPNSDSWYWDDVFSADDEGDNETVLFTMDPGTYTLEIGYREDGALMDTILISKVE